MKVSNRVWVLVLFVLALGACTKTETEIRKVDPLEAQGLARNGFAVLVDVREANEVAQGMAAGAKWIPLPKIEANDPEWTRFLQSTPQDQLLIFYCRSGRRSNLAAEIARKAGKKAANMGGFSGWLDQKLPTQKPPQNP